jgi:hypothetical protein
MAMRTPATSVLPIAAELGRTASTEFRAAGVWISFFCPSISVSKPLIDASFDSVQVKFNNMFGKVNTLFVLESRRT